MKKEFFQWGFSHFFENFTTYTIIFRVVYFFIERIMLQKSLKAFTLIELLVVITIIGILATGAVQVFTSQIQKARDTTRVSDITALRGGVEQFYQDNGAYPDKGASFSGVTLFVPKLPSDPKTTQFSNDSIFDYLYNVGEDDNGISGQEFEISAHFENKSNTDNKSAQDGGDDDARLEFGIDVSDASHPSNAA